MSHLTDISAIRALEKLLMAKNRIKGAEAGKALGDMLAINTVLKELDLSDQGNGDRYHALDSACAKELAVGLGANGALTHLDISRQTYEDAYGDTVGGIGAEGAKAIAEALKSNVSGLDL